MIILKHLTVERFRLLRELNLHFPQRGSILIQGPNESGKSALLESIYFALYGESLAPKHGKRSLDDLILYGTNSATVTLTLSIGATEMTITRTIERKQGQKVVLYLHRLGMVAEEPITQLQAANERIIAELGLMDGATLRNAALLEQKGLSHLENLPGVEREATVRKLLGLEKLSSLMQRYKITPEDEQSLHDASERLHLAEIQSRIPEVSSQLEQIDAALDAVCVREKLDDIDQQAAEIAEQELGLAEINTRRLELKSRQGRAQQLKKADATLAQIISTYDEIAEARRELPELEKQLAELERREYDELPALEQRVNDLADLTKSFGTLQRMSNDLLSAVETIKALEQDLKQYDEFQDDLKNLAKQVSHAQLRVQQAQQALDDLEEQRHSGRPQLEARLERMKNLVERLKVLQQVEAQYQQRLTTSRQIEENRPKLHQLQQELRATEHEQALAEAEAQRVQQQANALEQRWRQISIRHKLQEWQHQKGLVQGLSQAQDNVRQAHQYKEQLNHTHEAARNRAILRLVLTAGCLFGVLACGIAALFLLSNVLLFPLVLLAIALAAGSYYNYHTYGRAHEEQKATNQQMQEATNRVTMMVAAREAAACMGGDPETLNNIEQEIRSLGGTVPHSLEEAQRLLDQSPDQGESLAELQKEINTRRDEADTTRNQVNVIIEEVVRLRKELSQLDQQRQQEDWDNIEENLNMDQATVERMQQEITLLAGQEGLPLASIDARLQKSGIIFDSYSSGQLPAITIDQDDTGVPDLESLIENTIRATEQELASLNGKLDLVTDLAAQVKIHQEALDILLARQKTVEESNAHYQTDTPAMQIARAREQQAAMRQALQSLHDSLRQRVKSLGITFGQATVATAEAAARKQLESLQITLDGKILVQEKHTEYATRLKEGQASLPDHYKQLSKYSNTLGSWIVPLNPFAEALISLRTRCQYELEEINEPGILQEFISLQNQEGAAKARIELCHQDIDLAQENIATLLIQRGRPSAQSYTLEDLVAVWPLLNEHTAQDRQTLEEQSLVLEKDLADLEAQDLSLSAQLGAEYLPLDLAQARTHNEQQQRSYQIKKHATLIGEAVNERLLRKMSPRTEYYMQQILPLLTSGRYHDVHLTIEPEEGSISGGPFQLLVWDPSASEYVPKSALSGGAADQLSLALRLAFAIASLPRELSAAPGFVILDEPLSSFDRGRAQALVDVITGEVLSQHFEQILLISHSSAFDPAMFPYHVYMDNGQIAESNLPVVPELAPAPPTTDADLAIHLDANEEDAAEDNDDMTAPTVRVAAIPSPTLKN